jgi:hypothetical protein
MSRPRSPTAYRQSAFSHLHFCYIVRQKHPLGRIYIAASGLHTRCNLDVSRVSVGALISPRATMHG